MINMLSEIVGDKDDTLEVTIHIRSLQTNKEKAFRIVNASTTMGAMANTVIDSANSLGFIVEEVKDKVNPHLPADADQHYQDKIKPIEEGETDGKTSKL